MKPATNPDTVSAVLRLEADDLFRKALSGVERFFRMFDEHVASADSRRDVNDWVDTFYRVILGEMDRTDYALLSVKYITISLLGAGTQLEIDIAHCRTVLVQMQADFRDVKNHYLTERIPAREAA